MKVRSFLWAMLPMVAAMMLTSCSSGSDDVAATPTAPTQKGAKKIPYTVVVGSSVTTRATVGEKDANNKYPLYFAKGDKLYAQSADGKVYGVLPVEDQYEGLTEATFTGELTVEEGATLTDQTPITVTLVGKDNVGVQINGDKVTGINYGTALCGTLDEAVRKYSLLTDTKPYNNREFYIQQQTAFVDFTITLDEGTYDGATLGVELKNFDGNREGQVTAHHVYTPEDTYGTIQAHFFVCANKNAAINKDAATLKMGSNAAQTFFTNNHTLQAGVSTVNKTVTDEGVQLWADGPKWGKANLGANRDVDYGNYFAWGETTPGDATHFVWTNYKYCNGTQDVMTKYNSTDNLITLALEDDAANAILGSTWRMPTALELQRLDKLTNKIWYDGDSQKYRCQNTVGMMFIGDGIYSHKAIFLPAAGAYTYRLDNSTSDFVRDRDACLYLSSQLDVNSLWAQLDYPIWYDDPSKPNVPYGDDDECKQFYALRYDFSNTFHYIWVANRCDGFTIRGVK